MENKGPELNNRKELPETEEINAPGGQTPEDEDTKKSINWRGLIIGAVAFVVIITVTLIFLRFTDEAFRFKELPIYFKSMNGWYVLLALLCLFAYIVSEGRAIAASGHGIGIKINYKKSTIYSCVELFFAALTPSASGGQPAVAYFMSKDGIKLSKSSVILLNNTLHYTVSLFVLSTFAMIWKWDFIFAPERGKYFIWLFISGYIANILGLLSCLLFIFAPGLVRTIFTPVYRLLAKMHIIKDLDRALASFEKSVAEYSECQKTIRRSPGAQIQTFLWNCAQRTLNCLVPFFVYRALGGGKPMIEILVIQILILCSVNAIPLPGSVGASEMVHKQLYQTLYSVGSVTPAMIITRTFNFYIMVVIVGIVSVAYYIHILKEGRKKSDIERLGS